MLSVWMSDVGDVTTVSDAETLDTKVLESEVVVAIAVALALLEKLVLK